MCPESKRYLSHAFTRCEWLVTSPSCTERCSFTWVYQAAMKGNPSALRVISNIGALPIHIACQFSSSKVVKHLVELDEGRTLHYNDMIKDSPLHYACRGGNLGVVKYLLSEHTYSLVSSMEVNEKGELPIHLLCEAVKDKVDIADSTEYTEIIWKMLLANPEAIWG